MIESELGGQKKEKMKRNPILGNEMIQEWRIRRERDRQKKR